jgi:mono/diheme cytochrome c family protein
MAAPRETGKLRAARIPLTYFQNPDRMVRWKLRLTVWALILSIGWWTSSIVLGNSGRRWETRGEVCAVHAAWNLRCEACHVDFSPMAGENWLMKLISKPVPADARCQSCHMGYEQQRHHANENPKDIVSCGSCHRDHRGPDASLVMLPDSDCTSCHAQLANHLAPGTKTTFLNAARFGMPPAHPEFKLFRDKQGDPGKLKFNHKIHMTAGLRISPEAKAWTLADVPDESERKRYADDQKRRGLPADPAAAIQLDCSSCHQLDSGDFSGLFGGLAAGLMPPRAPGAYFQPIVYENQCKACHPLTFDAKLPNVSIPHRLQPDQVRDFLWGAYAQVYVKDPGVRDRLKQAAPSTRPLPGKLSAEEEKAARQIQAQLEGAEKFLWKTEVSAKETYLYAGKTTCGECHSFMQNPAGRSIVVPPAVPDVWFTHAKFSHVKHRSVNCKQCHDNAYPDAVNASTEARDVLVPGIDNCVQCHSPPHRGTDGQPRGGVRFQCTECHRYHNGDMPLQGPGAVHRDPRVRRDIGAVLSGSLHEKAPAPMPKAAK